MAMDWCFSVAMWAIIGSGFPWRVFQSGCPLSFKYVAKSACSSWNNRLLMMDMPVFM